MSITVSHLTKLYDEQKAINDISFDIPKGEIVGFLGPNGAGKSTTLKIITGFLPATSGTAKVCGFDVAINSMEVRKNIGYLPETNPLYTDMYVREYLSFMAGLHGLGKQSKKRIEEVIDLTGLLPESKKKIEALSKGYRQRVGLAQAILHDPPVLILDEPTSGLDPNQLVDIRELIKNMGTNKTVILSTHILQEVKAMCSKVIIINKGKIVADDTIDALQSIRKTGNIITIEWEKIMEPGWFGGISGILEATPLTSQKWKLTVEKADEIRKNLLQFALQNNLNIISLQSETQSLEAIFRELTLS
jgi:gliding motility-associated transport system ATP-binding protein